MQQKLAPIELPELPYSVNALEPVLVGEILAVHHGKHHRGYVNKYNNLAESLVDALYKNETTKAQTLASNLFFNAGGHNCHAMYWENLAPEKNGGGVVPDPNGLLGKAIAKEWGSLDKLIAEFNVKTGGVKGSGWGWLALDPNTKALTVETTPNQDYIETNGRIPLLTVDVWEHAYYLQYKNLRPDYLKQIWRVINWRTVEERYNKAVL